MAELAQRGLPPAPAIPSIPGQKRWKAGLEYASSLLEAISQEMQNYFEERSEEWQESERGEAHSEAAAAVEDLAHSVRELFD